MLDLTTTYSSGSINGAWFYQADPQSTGTGLLPAFLKVQASPTEQGYNTKWYIDNTNKKGQFDEMAPNFDRNVMVSHIPLLALPTGLYREIVLDINEPNNLPNSLLSLEKLQIYLSDVPDLYNYQNGILHVPGTDAPVAPIYDMDFGEDSWIKLDSDAFKPGSGIGDMYAYIPAALFPDPNQYMTLFCRFGDHYPTVPGTDSADGPDEWGLRDVGQVPVIPEYGSLSLALLGFLPVAAARIRRRR